MDLLLDAGNSRLKAALREGEELRPLPPIVWREIPIPEGLIEQWESVARPERVWCANVAGAAAADAIARASRRLWRIEPEFTAVRESACGVRNRYRRLDQLGVDRWLAAIGGFKRARGACCVVDCGTAITAELVTAQGDYLGGMIAPGPCLMARSLSGGTAQLLEVRAMRAEGIGNDTESCIAAGVGGAIAGLLERIPMAARKALNGEPAWFITGGAAGVIAPIAPIPFVEVPLLVLEGLAHATRDYTNT